MSGLLYKKAMLDDVPLLARFNGELLQDEQHNLRLTQTELEERMRGYLQGISRRVICAGR